MNNNLADTELLISGLKENLKNVNAEVIICPPYTSLSLAKSLLSDCKIKLGAQNMYFEESGAFTGEISASMLESVGCEYVIIGHSERRTIFNESDELINKKIKRALSAKLKPIFCIGETLTEREAEITNQICEKQLRGGLVNISEDDLANIIIAYEPVWAIGTGKTASKEQAQEVHLFIRNLIKTIYSESAAQKIIIQYGGSVKPENANDLLTQPDIDGALVGGACLKVESFASIVKSV